MATIVLLLAAIGIAQKSGQNQTVPAPGAAAEDISGIYSFLKDGEFVQINLEASGVTGFISSHGDLESDRGVFLDHFFSTASVHGHDVSFATKPVHGVWFEFNGRFDRGKAKDKTEDGYYVVRGTLTEFVVDADKKTRSQSRETEFKWLAQPDDNAPAAPAKPKSSSQTTFALFPTRKFFSPQVIHHPDQDNSCNEMLARR